MFYFAILILFTHCFHLFAYVMLKNNFFLLTGFPMELFIVKTYFGLCFLHYSSDVVKIILIILQLFAFDGYLFLYCH